MDANPLKAAARDSFGKGSARKLRATGAIPALIYRAGDEPKHISIDPKELRLLFQRTGNENTIVDVQIDGAGNHTCLLRQTQKHPVSRALLHADFYEIVADQAVVVEIAVETTGKAKGAIVGGRLRVLRRTVPVSCLPKDIPTKVVIDVSEMELNDIIRMSEVALPKGCAAAAESDFNILSLVGRRMTDTPVEEEAAEAEA